MQRASKAGSMDSTDYGARKSISFTKRQATAATRAMLPMVVMLQLVVLRSLKTVTSSNSTSRLCRADPRP